MRIHVKTSWAPGFTLGEYKLSDTISHIMDEIIKKIKEIGMLCPQPEEGLILTLLSGPHLERDNTLASAVKLADVNDLGPLNTITMMLVFPFRPSHDSNGELLSIPERKDPDMFVEASSAEEEDDDEEDGEDYFPLKYKGRKGKIPIYAVVPDLGIDGDIELLDEDEQPVSISNIMVVETIISTASAVLLATNDRILNHLYALNKKEQNYVILRVGIDLLSYAAVRVFRQFFPEMPIVAITDLDLAHLDIIAFLDSEVFDVRRLYGLDLVHYGGFSVSDNVAYIEEVDIKWLGLRYSHRGSDLVTEAEFDALARPPSSDFDTHMRRLLRSSTVCWKNSWFRELWHLKKDPKCVDFPSCGYDSIATMISNKDWA